MSEEIKPCPFCGGDKIDTVQGSTFRWYVAVCGECGAQAGEVRMQTMGTGDYLLWEKEAKADALKEWNRRKP